MHVSDLETPVPVVDLDILERNLDRFARYSAEGGVALRPHVKTHKSPRIGVEQIRRGAIGLTCATTREAEVMAEVTDDILLAYPPVGAGRRRRVAGPRCLLGPARLVPPPSEEGTPLMTNAPTAGGALLRFGLFMAFPAGYDRDAPIGRPGSGADHFLTDSDSSVPLDLLATKYRTKKAFLEGFVKLHLFVVTLRCEHTCQYCQVSRVTENRTRFDMNPDLEIKVLELYRQKRYEEMVRTIQEVPGVPEANLALRNTGALKFEKTGADWGLDFVAVSQGAALVDFDRDGDLDVVCNNFSGDATIWSNGTTGRHAIAVELVGRGQNRFGLGALASRCTRRTAAWSASSGPHAATRPLSAKEPT